MKGNIQKIASCCLYLILAFLIVKDCTYQVPYKTELFDGSFWPLDSPFSFTWLLLLILSVVLTIPLFKRHKIGLLGLVLFLTVLAKPIIIPKVSRETAQDFFEAREKEFVRLVQQYKHSGATRVTNSELSKIGVEQLIIHKNTYIFIIDSFLDNSHGFVYSEGRTPSLEVLQANTSYTPLKGKWYKYSAT